jgi:DMSO/TMAO reductase YedYZ molybdopterin-dependent catalytic subunit
MSEQDRRSFITRSAALIGVAALGGCTDVNRTQWWPNVLDSAEGLSRWAQRLFAGSHALAQEFTKADIAPVFRANGTLNPNTESYAAMAANGFHDWRLSFEGLVENPISFSLEELQAMPARSQITRHDCVEGWSCIGEWKGVPLAHLLAMAKPKKEARFAVFYCMDPMDSSFTADVAKSPYYYETLDLLEATHPQTIVAYELNGASLPVEHGAPTRLRAERQLGYKNPKYLERIALVDSYAEIQGGKGGYWEDQGYTQWGGI